MDLVASASIQQRSGLGDSSPAVCKDKDPVSKISVNASHSQRQRNTYTQLYFDTDVIANIQIYILCILNTE